MKREQEIRIGTIIRSARTGRAVRITDIRVDMALAPGMVWAHFRDVENPADEDSLMRLDDMVQNVEDGLLEIIGAAEPEDFTAAREWYAEYRGMIEEMEDAQAEESRCLWQGRAQAADHAVRKALGLRRAIQGMEKAAVLLGFTDPDGPICAEKTCGYKLRGGEQA